MPLLYDRVKLTLMAIKAYRTSDPARGVVLAEGLCDLSSEKGPLPVLRMKGWTSKLEWEFMLLPDISFADSPKVRGYLDTCLTGSDGFLEMDRIGAWSNLDIDKAVHLVDDLLQGSPNAGYGAHGQTINHGYELFLINLAKADPKSAARRLAELKFTPVSIPEGDLGGMSFIYAIRIIESLWPNHPQQAREFCEQPGPWSKAFGPKPGAVVDFLEIADKVRDDPLHSRPLLIQMADCPSRIFLMGVGLVQTTTAAVKAAAKVDPDAGIALSDVITSPSDRCRVLLAAFEDSRALPFDRRSRLLDTAMSLAKSISDPEGRIDALLSVAGQAKKSWRRLQAWPPPSG